MLEIVRVSDGGWDDGPGRDGGGCVVVVVAFFDVVAVVDDDDVEDDESLVFGFDLGFPVEPVTGAAVLVVVDDSGGALNSRITYRATFTGGYRVIARSLGGRSTGPFVFEVQQK